MKTKSTLILLGILAITPFAHATSLNIHFGFSFSGTSAATFGAAAAQPGTWNRVTSGSATSLVDLTGAATGVQITGSATTFGGTPTVASHTGDYHPLLDYNFFSNPGVTWSFTLTGLINGSYTVYYYAPANLVVDSGAFTLNGVAAPTITGSTNTFTQGVDWQVLENVVVTDGTMNALSGISGTYEGLASLQIVATPAAVPESGSTAFSMLFALGTLALLGRSGPWLRAS